MLSEFMQYVNQLINLMQFLLDSYLFTDKLAVYFMADEAFYDVF